LFKFVAQNEQTNSIQTYKIFIYGIDFFFFFLKQTKECHRNRIVEIWT